MKKRLLQLLTNRAFWLVVMTSISGIAAIKLEPEKIIIYGALGAIFFSLINFITQDYRKTKTRVDDILNAATSKFRLKDNEDDKCS